jgi:hypothetical protein
MNFKLRIAAACILAVALVALSASASGFAQSTPAKKHSSTQKAAAPKTPPSPSVEEQIQALRQALDSQGIQIDNLKSDLADKDARLKKAEQAAADAQAEAAKAQAAASAQNQAVSDNAAAVTTLQTTVTDLKGNEVALATTISDETAGMKKSIESPTVLHYKGVSITPGGYGAAETVYRTKATGGDIATAFNALPYEKADAYTLSEFFGSARQSRLSLAVEGKTNWGTLKGYYEADFLGAGITSNNNQSNSYVLRQRVVWASAETSSRWKFVGGQMWSLATETKKGISNESGDVLTPLTIDPNYVPGFAWARQYGFRVVKSFDKAAVGISVENPQLLYTASIAGNTPYAVLGSAGNNGGAYNAAISGCTPATSIVNYSNQQVTDGAGNLIDVAVPVYKTLNGCANIANLSFNQAPDVLGKIAFDPGWGHYEIFGIAGFAHETLYPGETTNSNLYGGNTDIAASQAATLLTGVKTTILAAPALTSAGAVSNSILVGGIGASMRVPLIGNKLTFGAKGLYGPGVGRYGDSTLADVTSDWWGGLAPIHNLSGLFTVEDTPTPRLTLYVNYGGDYAGRDDYSEQSNLTLGAPNPCFITSDQTGCQNTVVNATTGAVSYPLTLPNTLTQAEIAAGKWGSTWSAPVITSGVVTGWNAGPNMGPVAVGYGSRFLSNSGCLTFTNPGYNGGASTGYATGGSCGAQTRDVQELTGGYWYDLYKGDRGRLRQGIQYGYAVREGWSGVAGIGAKGIDNMFWTTFRYYLP